MAITGLFSTRSGSRLGVSPQWYTSLASVSSSDSTCCCCCGTSGPLKALLMSSRTSVPFALSVHIELSHSRLLPSTHGLSQITSSWVGASKGGGGRTNAGSCAASDSSLSPAAAAAPPSAAAEQAALSASSPPSAAARCRASAAPADAETVGCTPCRLSAGMYRSRSATARCTSPRSGGGSGSPAPSVARISSADRLLRSLFGGSARRRQSRLCSTRLPGPLCARVSCSARNSRNGCVAAGSPR
mmetsp:Transcript_19395/g.50040  ORF Transcript_19395/g.50040 Transcript_19395/m.50040 type:complete len:244 (+) Transcript_19395:497-1228(+)